MNDPARPLPNSVINCAAYDRHGARRDITLDQISDVLAVDQSQFLAIVQSSPSFALKVMRAHAARHERIPAAS